jgi:Domain of unknown function (DUF6398)
VAAAKQRNESVPQHMRAVFDAIVAITDPFCTEHFNAEYAEVCRRLAAALSRKRPSPLASGNVRTWACAIVYTAGSVNFLFDRSQTPFMSAADLAARFDVAKSTAGNKSKAVRDALKIKQFDWHWCLPSQVDSYPLAWMIQVDGIHVDARLMPREIQEEAFDRGFIPCLPKTTEFS